MKIRFHFLSRKHHPVIHHVLAASVIITYWWALWNILDALFLNHVMNIAEVASIVVIAIISLFLFSYFDEDFSDF
ncbi:hypothetical protein H6768_01365 [Candidatus Peribacteria bacterium]|nr:hypothetical protein [Candidatus Peribacteria bacterium]